MDNIDTMGITIRVVTTVTDFRFYQTIVSATNACGDVIAWNAAVSDHHNVSASSYNASKVVAARLIELGIDNADIFVKGLILGRQSAIEALMDSGITINLIKDTTPSHYHGCSSMIRERKK